MNIDIDNSLKEKLFECDKHVNKIYTAKKHLSVMMPLTVHSYKEMTDVEESFVDQLIFRFSKLQDTLGEKIFPFLLKFSGEEVKRKTFIDILNRLEELEILNRIEWLSLREIRNDIAHEYSNNTDQFVESIIAVYTACDKIIEVYKSVTTFCRQINPALFKEKI